MKKIVALLVAVFLLSMLVPVQAQLKFGVKGGLNLGTSLSDTWKDKANADNYTGFFVGPMAEFRVPLIGIGVDGALLYSQKGNKLAGETMKQQGIEIPINLKYSIGLGSLASVYLAAGPSFYYNMNSDDKFALGGEDGVVKYEDTEVALNLGFGVKLLRHLQIGANYNMPFSNSAKVHTTGEGLIKDLNGKSFKTKMWQVSVAYMF